METSRILVDQWHGHCACVLNVEQVLQVRLVQVLQVRLVHVEPADVQEAPAEVDQAADYNYSAL